MSKNHPEAPALQISQWLNAEADLTLASLRGRVVVLHAFQMLCPACVSHGLPQAKKMQQLFDAKDVAVIGLHSVFEHHAVMTPEALKAFVHEYRLSFPIGIDQPSRGGIPATMREYQLQGTPSIVLIDRQGRIRLSHFGVIDDMVLGAAIGQLAAEVETTTLIARPSGDAGMVGTRDACGESGCPA
ncbi:redoxin family protein [Variovorax saccharolyticus]|uniref:redoxin family protein n=1 Tax=Variovorax saccharolyticus TaxID=3053516 RepID=UPI002576D0AB|nr:redoxin family protein [Variovorax sp. J22R187]MDM0018347.1 redoxin family protein [Variovorax sp. J22R187]